MFSDIVRWLLQVEGDAKPGHYAGGVGGNSTIPWYMRGKGKALSWSFTCTQRWAAVS